MISLCIKENNSHIQNFLIQKLYNSNLPNIYYSSHTFKNYQNIVIHYKGNDLTDFYNYLSEIISCAILKFYEPKIVKSLITKNYFYFSNYEQDIIYNEYCALVTTAPFTSVVFNVSKYIRENKSIILNGFVNFRLKNYISQLNELIENAVNKFIIDKEYIEFVSLLKTYVDSKTPNPEVIDLIYVNSEAILLDENGDYIDTESFDCEYLSDITFSQNDYVLNTLIGRLPQKIRVHLISPKDEFIHTLELIFGSKITVCLSCDLCTTYKFLNLK